MTALVQGNGIHYKYRSARSNTWQVRDASITIHKGVPTGIVGESGSGKSTLIRVICGFISPASGTVEFDGRDVQDWLQKSPHELRRRNQMVFQSPASSFDPRMRISQSLAEPVRALDRRRPTSTDLEEMVADVGLSPVVLRRYPYQLSGGQLQRLAIARALAAGPSVLYADEATSSLDVSVQAQVLNLLMSLRESRDLTLVLVSHNIAVLSRVCEQIVVMKDGRIVEAGQTQQVLSKPTSDYTAALVDSARAVAI